MRELPSSLILSTTAEPAPADGHARLRRGIHVATDTWATAYVEERQRLRAHAVAASAETPPVFSHLTAVAEHRLPLFGVYSTKAHVIARGEHPAKSRGDVVRHHVPLDDTDITSIDGILVTTLDRTVYDAIRMLPPESGLAVFDAALRSVAWDEESRTIDEAASEELHEAVRARVFAGSGARGIRRARIVTELADGRAQLPGESVSRYRMWELGMPMPDLQVRVVTALGVRHLDTAWPGLRRFGEFDGEVKLFDPAYARGRTPAEVREDQAARRSAVEDATGWRGMHWGMDALADASTFHNALVAQGWPRHLRP